MKIEMPEQLATDAPKRVAYTLPEVASMLGTCYKTAYLLVRDGKLASVKIGRKHRVLKADLDDFLNSTRQPAWR